MASTRWRAPELSTDSVAAVEHYRDGVAALVAGAPHAGAHFGAATAADPSFALALVASALVRRHAVELPPTAVATRGERQHVETIRTWLCGDESHARDLRREHLLEFPGDLLIVVLPLLVSR